MKPSEIKEALALVGGRTNKRLGQHFLIDKAVLADIVDAAAIKPGDVVLEVGPGLGVLTRALLERGAEVVAIEQDRRFVEYLNKSIVDSREFVGADDHASARIVPGDAATIHWHQLIGERPWKFVSNLPYAISSLALRKALWAPKPPEVAVVLVQREVAERAVQTAESTVDSRGPKRKKSKNKTSLLSLMVALASEEARIVRRVPAGCFYPAPKVESAVLRIVPMPWEERGKKWGMDSEKIMETAKRGFAHPRKLLKSNLGFGGADDHSPLRDLGIDEKSRAEDLSPEDWAKLARAIE